MTDDDTLKRLLDEEALLANTPAFAEADPVQFPRRYSDPRDIEAAALLCATIAWGRRTMILRNCTRLLALMHDAPYRYIADEGWRDIPPGQNLHRTFFGRNLQHYLRGLHRIFSRYGSVEALAAQVADREGAPWHLARLLQQELTAANDGVADPRCLPANLRHTPLKRLNMALRWLVRRDGIVDIGLWQAWHPRQLYIPLDVHVGNTARHLGLTDRRANDRRAVDQITAHLRRLRPDDPCYYDFALFSISERGETQK